VGQHFQGFPAPVAGGLQHVVDPVARPPHRKWLDLTHTFQWVPIILINCSKIAQNWVSLSKKRSFNG